MDMVRAVCARVCARALRVLHTVGERGRSEDRRSVYVVGLTKLMVATGTSPIMYHSHNVPEHASLGAGTHCVTTSLITMLITKSELVTNGAQRAISIVTHIQSR